MKVRGLQELAIVTAGCVVLSGCASGSSGFTPDEDDGAVTLSCAPLPDGRLSDCRVVSERPEGMELGAHALEAANEARLSARSLDAVSPGGRIEFTIRFKMENGVLVERPASR